jgi:tripartite-type tricarboxylate transporter receptor subunit TctC
LNENSTEARASRRRFSGSAGLLLVGGAVFLPPLAKAQSFPAGKLIKLICGTSPGTASDILGRALADRLTTDLGVSVIVENKPGGAGLLAAQAVLAAPADGHTIFVQGTAHTVTPFLYKLPYDPLRDFSGATSVGAGPNVLLVPPSSGYKSVQELIADAKARPGALNYASAGRGSNAHFAAEKFRLAAAIDVVHVPMKNAVDVVTETVAGRTHWALVVPTTGVVELVKAGRLTPLGVSSLKRSALFPDVPTFAELGLKGAESTFWLGLLVSSKTSRDVVRKLNQVTVKAMESDEVRVRLIALGCEPMSMTPEQFDAYLREEMAVNEKIAKQAGII